MTFEKPDIDGAIARIKAMQNARPDLPENRQSEERRRTAGVLRDFGVPTRVRRQLGGLAATAPLRAVREWMGSGQWCLTMAAPPGVGKTMAAGWWLAQHVGDLKPDPTLRNRWWPCTALARMSYYGPEFAALLSVPQLVLDDLGVEFSDERGMFASKLDDLLDARYRECRPTIITTNLTAKAFVKRHGERVFDRLREDATWSEFRGPSMRGRR